MRAGAMGTGTCSYAVYLYTLACVYLREPGLCSCECSLIVAREITRAIVRCTPVGRGEF